MSKKRIESKLHDEYQNKLRTGSSVLPEPLDSKEDWIGEEKGIQSWPRLYLTDTTRFYADVIAKKGIITFILRVYKQGKGKRRLFHL